MLGEGEVGQYAFAGSKHPLLRLCWANHASVTIKWGKDQQMPTKLDVASPLHIIHVDSTGMNPQKATYSMHTTDKYFKALLEDEVMLLGIMW